jgi:hypothetical protein
MCARGSLRTFKTLLKSPAASNPPDSAEFDHAFCGLRGPHGRLEVDYRVAQPLEVLHFGIGRQRAGLITSSSMLRKIVLRR